MLECNDKPYISGETDKALLMRIMDIPFNSTFTKIDEDVDEANHIYLGDDSVKDVAFKEQHKFALFHIIIDAWKLYQEKGMNIDKFVTESSRQSTEVLVI